jgi:hypothetical protein
MVAELEKLDPEAKFAQECEDSLSDYPILSESDHSELEHEECCEAWENMRLRERVKLCQRCGVSVFAARRSSIPEKCYDYLREHLE